MRRTAPRKSTATNRRLSRGQTADESSRRGDLACRGEMMAERNHHPAPRARVVRDRRSPPRAYVRRVIVFASIQAVHIVRRKPMIRSWTLAAIGLAACSSIEAMAADPLPTESFKILPAALAVEAAEAAIERICPPARLMNSSNWRQRVVLVRRSSLGRRGAESTRRR